MMGHCVSVTLLSDQLLCSAAHSTCWIQVCGKCALRSSCKFVNQRLGGKNTRMAKNELSLLYVLRVITLYALELVPPTLTIPDDLKVSSNRLLRHIVELSRTTTKIEVKT